jgi:competence protein ComEA
MEAIMIRKLLLAVATLAACMGIAFAQVDVNKADQAALDSVKAIMAERAKGEFKDWADLEQRVKGIGEKNATKLSEAGLLVNGKSREGAAPARKETARK